MAHRDETLAPEIISVDSFAQMFDALRRPEVKACISDANPFKYQNEIEDFNETGREVYVVIAAPLNRFHEKLDQQLKKKGLDNNVVRHAFVEHVYQLAHDFVEIKKPREDKWDVTVTSTFLKNTQEREWHIDSYDATGKTYQMTKTLAGHPGTLVSHSRDYDRKAFEVMRDERREKEVWHQNESLRIQREVQNPIKQKLLKKKIDIQLNSARSKMVLEMERLLKSMPGHATEAQDIILFRGGDVPHSSPVLNRRRLVFTMVEFDEFMDLEQANRKF
jgi:hypothetical protein